MEELKNESKFDNDSRAKAFEELESKYYNKNFGTLSKSDFEILMFKIYYERSREKSNNILDYDNYSISKDLGITESKVKLLKEKMGLKYPNTIQWKEEIGNHIKAFEYFEDKQEIKFIIDDDYCLKEFQRLVLNSGCFYDGSFNSRIITFKIESFFKLFKDESNVYDVVFNKELKEKIQKKCPNNNELLELLKEVKKENIKKIIQLSSKTIVIDILKSLYSQMKEPKLLNIFIKLMEKN